MKLNVDELLELVSTVQRRSENGVALTGQINEKRIAVLEEQYAASERDIQTRDEAITALLGQLSTYHGPEAWDDAMTTISDLRGELHAVTVERDALERRLATYEPAVQPVGTVPGHKAVRKS